MLIMKIRTEKAQCMCVGEVVGRGRVKEGD
jgi:hypothetical protein